jgi:hypothetical protein
MKAQGVWPWMVAAALGTVCARPARADDAGCVQRGGAALTQLACETAAALAGKADGALVVAAPLSTELEPREPQRLVVRLASLTAAALGKGAAVEARALSLVDARLLARARRVNRLLHLSVRLSRDRLEVTADLYDLPGRFWQRVKNPEPGLAGHAFATRALDAEIRSFLPPVPLIAKRTERVTGSDADVLALACGDTDGDASSELVVVGRHRIQVGRIRAGRFQVERSVAWSTLSQVAPAPWREPIGSAWIARPGSLEVGTTDRAEAVRLDQGLVKIASLGRALPWPGTGGCAQVQALGVSEDAKPCAAKPVSEGPKARADAIAGAAIVLPDGGRRVVRAQRNSLDRSVTVSDEAGLSARLELAGAGLAIGDLDGNGIPELLSSVETLDAKQDAVIAHSWDPSGKLIEKLRVPVPAGVRALAVCPLEGSGIAPIAVGTAEGLWLVY